MSLGAMDLAAASGAGHPAVAVLLGLAAAAVAGGVVAMAWNIHVRQIRLAEQLARRQFIVTAEAPAPDSAPLNGHAGPALGGPAELGPGAVAINGPDTVIAGEQARYRIWPAGQQAVSWAAGGGPVSQAPDPAHPGELLLIADEPGTLTITARVREGMTERRAVKTITAVTDVNTAVTPVTLRLFLHGWGLIAVGALIAGFAGALTALGDLAAGDFIALTVALAAVLGVVSARASGDTPSQLGSLRTPPPGSERPHRDHHGRDQHGPDQPVDTMRR
jgi:hypothetical protein